MIQSSDDSSHLLRMAGWAWLAFLLGMVLVDFVLYTPQMQGLLTGRPFLNQPRLPIQLDGSPLLPIYVFYAANSLACLLFLALTYWEKAKTSYPLMLLFIAAVPILINTLIVPRFPGGTLGDADAMALRQLPVLFIALSLVAWEYRLKHVILFALGSAALEWSLLLLRAAPLPILLILGFIIVIRTLSFIAVGIFINLLRARLREANLRLSQHAATLEQLTVSRERNRLARDLHDTLAHSLAALTISLETAIAYFDLDREKTRSLLEASLETARRGADETRGALRALHASDLEDLGLRLALQKLAQSAAARAHLDLELDLPAALPPLRPDAEQTLYRIAQEAIENIVRHAQAKKLTLRLFHDGRTNLLIANDGIGFDLQQAARSGHYGLAGMRERAELAGGRLDIESQKGKGTRV